MDQRSDLELIREFKNGNEKAYNVLVLRYQEKIYWVVRRLLPDHDEADDVVQDVFVKVYRSLNSFKGDSSFYTWLYIIAENLSLNEIRRKKTRKTFALDDSVTQYESDEEAPSRKNGARRTYEIDKRGDRPIAGEAEESLCAEIL